VASSASRDESAGVVTLDAGYRDPRQYWMVLVVVVMVLLALTTVYRLSKQALSLADRAVPSAGASHRSSAVAQVSRTPSPSSRPSASATATASAVTTPVAVATVPASATSCGHGISAGRGVSCGLARAVATKAAGQSGSFSLKATSPSSGVSYRFSCLTQGIVVCSSSSIKVYVSA